MVLGDSPVRLWGLTPAERLVRQLRAERIRVSRDDFGALRQGTTVLLFRGDCLYDARVIRGLAKASAAMLAIDVDGGTMSVAAHVDADQVGAMAKVIESKSMRSLPDGIATLSLGDVAKGYEAGLKKLDRPFVVPLTEERRGALERLTFSGAYKGVTDLVTKFVWPAPAQAVTRWCASIGMTSSIW